MRTKILMPQYEPTDKELNDLMKEVLVDVKNKAKLAKEKFDKSLTDALKRSNKF